MPGRAGWKDVTNSCIGPEAGARQVRLEPAENVGELLASHVRNGHESFYHSVDDTGVLGQRCVRKRRLAHLEFAHLFCDMRGPGVPRVVTSVTGASENDLFEELGPHQTQGDSF